MITKECENDPSSLNIEAAENGPPGDDPPGGDPPGGLPDDYDILRRIGTTVASAVDSVIESSQPGDDAHTLNDMRRNRARVRILALSKMCKDVRFKQQRAEGFLVLVNGRALQLLRQDGRFCAQGRYHRAHVDQRPLFPSDQPLVRLLRWELTATGSCSRVLLCDYDLEGVGEVDSIVLWERPANLPDPTPHCRREDSRRRESSGGLGGFRPRRAGNASDGSDGGDPQ